MVDPVSTLGAVAATSQLGKQVVDILSSTRKFYKDFRNAKSDHAEMFNRVKNIGAAIKSIASALKVVTADSEDGYIKQCLGGSDTGTLLEDAQIQLRAAEDLLHKRQVTTFSEKIRFVLKKKDIQELQLGLSQVGIWLSVALSSVIIETLMSGVSKSPQVEESMQQTLKQIHATIESVQKSLAPVPQNRNVASHDHSRRKSQHRSQRSREYSTTEALAAEPKKQRSRMRKKKSRTTVSPGEDFNILDSKNNITVDGSPENPELSHQFDARQHLEFSPHETFIRGSENQKTVRFQSSTSLDNANHGSEFTRYSTENDHSSTNLSVGMNEDKGVFKMLYTRSESRQLNTKSSSPGTAANKETEGFTRNPPKPEIKHNGASSHDNSSTRSSLRSRSIASDDEVEDHNSSTGASSNIQDKEADLEELRYSST